MPERIDDRSSAARRHASPETIEGVRDDDLVDAAKLAALIRATTPDPWGEIRFRRVSVRWPALAHPPEPLRHRNPGVTAGVGLEHARTAASRTIRHR